MFRLTRQVRLHVTEGDSTEPSSGPNGHAGTPPVDEPYYAIDVNVTLEGTPDPQNSYVRNIKEIDDQVRTTGLKIIRSHLNARPKRTFSVLAGELFASLADAWPGTRLAVLGIGPSTMTEYSIVAKDISVYRLNHRFEFSAAHRLHNPALDDAENRRLFGKCNNPLGHGHNYEVQVTLQSPGGRFPPIAEFERLVDLYAIDRLDHKNLNQEVDAFSTVNPSVEQIAQVVFHWLKTPLALGETSLAAVTVWETPRTWCEYTG